MINRFYETILNGLPMSVSQRLQYLLSHGRLPAVAHPRTLNEHLLRMKLNWSDRRYVIYSDKLAVKDVIANELGHEWVTPTLWSGKAFPNDFAFSYPYVVKANHGSGKVVFVRSAEDEVGLAERATRWLSQPMARKWGENWYRQIEPQLLVEPMIGDGTEAPVDYKFYCFDGAVACLQVDTGRFGDHHRSFYDPDWNKLQIRFGYPIDPTPLPPPQHLATMVDAAAKLSRGFVFARIDFYDLEEGPRFGEVTFCPASALTPYEPRTADEWLGSFWPRKHEPSILPAPPPLIN